MKFTVVFFAVLLAVVLSGTQASSIQGKLGDVREKVEELIENAVEKSRDALTGAQERGVKLLEELNGKVSEFVQKAQDQLAEVLQKVDDEMYELLSVLDEPNTDCQKLAGTVRDTAVAAAANVTRCVGEKLEAGQQHVQNIVTVSEEVADELKGLRDNAVQCTEGVDGIQATMEAISCVNKVGARAAAITSKAIPEVTANAVQIGMIVSTFRATVAGCAATTGYDALTESTNDLLNGVKECVKEAIESGKQKA